MLFTDERTCQVHLQPVVHTHPAVRAVAPARLVHGRGHLSLHRRALRLGIPALLCQVRAAVFMHESAAGAVQWGVKLWLKKHSCLLFQLWLLCSIYINLHVHLGLL